MKTGPKIRRRE